MKLNYAKSLFSTLTLLSCFFLINAQTTLTYSGGSWSPYAPSASTGADNAVIDDLCNQCIVGGAHLNDLTITNSNQLFIIGQTINVAGDFIIEDGSSFRVYSTGSGNVVVSGNSSIEVTGNNSLNNYNCWSSPFPGAGLGILSTFTSVNPCDVYAFNASSQEWKSDYSTPFSTTCNGNAVTFTSANVLTDGTADGNFDLGRGYFVPGSSSPTRVLTSADNFNNGTIQVAVYGSSLAVAGGNDWNLIGNPYPGPLRAGNVLSTNSSFINALYVYNGSTGTYTTRTAGSAYKIAPGQGFFIDANTTTDGYAGDFIFKNSHRVTSTYTFEKNSNDSSDYGSRIYLSLRNDFLPNDQTVIVSHPECLDLYDRKFDARKLRNTNMFNFSSLLVLDSLWGPEQCVINGLKTLEDQETKTIPLFIETPGSGNYEIGIDSLAFVRPGIGIVLEDLDNGSLTNLKNSDYQFNSTQKDSTSAKFVLHLSYDASVTSTSNLESIRNYLSVNYFSNQIQVKTLDSKILIENVVVYDLLGKPVAQNNGANNVVNINTSNLSSGLYIVKAVTRNGKSLSKQLYIN